MEVLQTDILEKSPAQLPDIEQVVLGAVILDKDAIHLIGETLFDYHFYDQRHQLIYQLCKGMAVDFKPIDLLTITEAAKTTLHEDQPVINLIGGVGYIVELTNRVASSANIEYHSRLIIQAWKRRALAQLGIELNRRAYDLSIDEFELQDFADQALLKITFQNESDLPSDSSKAGLEYVKKLQQVAERENDIPGISSGFPSVDTLTGGWIGPDLTILAARPGMGKTALMLAYSWHAAYVLQEPTLIFSLEMSKNQLVNRFVAMDSMVSTMKLKNPKQLSQSEWQMIHTAIERHEHAKLYYSDEAGISIQKLRSVATMMKKRHGIKLIMVDYLQLMTNPEIKHREQEISSISRGLKNLAKDLDVPIICLSQLSRAVETRGGSKRPQLSDLRESGAVEQDADNVAFVFRPEYYGIVEGDEGESLKGKVELIYAKHRNGETNTVNLNWVASCVKFTEAVAPEFQTITNEAPDTYGAIAPETRNSEDDVPF